MAVSLNWVPLSVGVLVMTLPLGVHSTYLALDFWKLPDF